MKPLHRLLPVAVIGVLVACLVAWPAQPDSGRAVAGSGGSGGFVSESSYPPIPAGTDFAFAPDGHRIFVASLRGEVRIIKDGVLLPAPFVTVPANENGERGLLGLALDPDFGSNGYVYLYYVYESNPADPLGPRTARLVRYTADGDAALPDSEKVLLGTVIGTIADRSCQDFPAGSDCIPADGYSHVGSALRFAPDGSLLLATGDAAFFPGVFSPLSLRSQDLDSLAGKLLRIDPATGDGLEGNPWFDDDEPDSNRSKVWARGLRQGFRMGLQPASGAPFIGEVGSSYWEEIDVGAPGANFGWPCYEGANRNLDYAGFSDCQDLYDEEPSTVHPLYAYARQGGASVTGGQFYEGSNYPADFHDAYFFGDWLRKTISVLKIDESVQLVPDSVQQVLDDAGNPVDFEIGPEGDIYYLSWGYAPDAEIRHLRFVPGNRPPVAQATALPQGGLTPLAVSFSSAGSFDPDGGPLTYAWNFGDGGSSQQQDPAHVYHANGTYKAQLTVTDSGGATAQDTVAVIVGNRPPLAVISVPGARYAYTPDESISFSGSGSDPETGNLPGSALAWSVFLHHCDPGLGICHRHPFLEGTGPDGNLIAPAQGGEVFYLELQLTVTDGGGLSDVGRVLIGPDSDGDGLLDFEEVLYTDTDRYDADSEDDGTSDGMEDPDGDGCASLKEVGPNAWSGGDRDPLDPWDYFNPTRDGLNRSDDIIAVVDRYFVDSGMPDYSADYDRTIISMSAWLTGKPDGRERVDDVLAIVRQYNHDCV